MTTSNTVTNDHLIIYGPRGSCLVFTVSTAHPIMFAADHTGFHILICIPINKTLLVYN